jgi:hypothetical protein
MRGATIHPKRCTRRTVWAAAPAVSSGEGPGAAGYGGRATGDIDDMMAQTLATESGAGRIHFPCLSLPLGKKSAASLVSSPARVTYLLGAVPFG